VKPAGKEGGNKCPEQATKMNGEESKLAAAFREGIPELRPRELKVRPSLVE